MKKLLFSALFSSILLSAQAQDIVNFRSYQTPVKHQGERGTCTAFGVAAALEILPGVPADISEQYLYASLLHLRPGKVEGGGHLREYPAILQAMGFIHEEAMPYNQRQIEWSNQTPFFERLMSEAGATASELGIRSAWAKYYLDPGKFQYYEGAQASDPEVIKQLLRSGHKAIAVTYYIHVPTWSRHDGNPLLPMEPNIAVWPDGKNGRKLSYPLAKLNYLKGDLLSDIQRGKVEYEYIETSMLNERGEIVNATQGHAVTIVGYNQYGFIIKNSWGEQWGNFGYGFLSFDSHRLFFREALLFKDVTFVQPKNKTPLRYNHELRLKTTVMGISSFNGSSNSLQLSLFTTDMFSDPAIGAVEFYLYNLRGNLIARKRALSKFIGSDYDGFTALFDTLLPLEVVGGNEALQVMVSFKDTNTGLIRTLYYPQIYFRTAEYLPSY